MATILVQDKAGYTMGKIESKAGLPTNVGTIIRSTKKAVFTNRKSVQLHGMWYAHQVHTFYADVASDPDFVPCGFLSQRQADELRKELAKGLSVREVARNYATYVETVRTVLAAYPAK